MATSEKLEQLVTEFVFKVNELGLQKFEKAQKRINKNTKEMIGLNSTLTKGFKRFIGFLGVGVGVKSLIDTYKSLDLTRRSIEGLTKSTQDWNYIQKEAIRTGTGIEAVAKGYRNFYSAASMAGFDKSGIQDMYSDVLTASRAIGATQQQVGGALLALEQMLSKGKVSMEELRRQLGNALPGAFEIGAKAMGVTTQKFNDMVKKGISSAEFVPKFTKELLNTYKEAFPQAIKSLDFAIVNLQTSWKLFQYEIMNGKAGQGFAETLNSLTEFLRSPEAIAIAKGIGQALNGMARALGFIVKHIKLILVLFGINMLSQLPNVFGKITRMLIKFNKELLVTGTITSGLNKILPKTVILLKAIGKTGLLLMKRFWWVFALAAIITPIAIALEDIFMYLRNPQALTLTRELVSKFPEIGEALERFKKGLNDFKKLWNNIAPEINNFLNGIIRWVAGAHPYFGGFFKWLIKDCIIPVIKYLTSILNLLNDIGNKNKRPEKEKKQDADRVALVGGTAAIGAMTGGVAGSFIPGIGTVAGAGVGAVVGGIGGFIGGSKLVDKFEKIENTTQNNTFHVQIVGGTSTPIEDIADKFMSRINGEIDNAKRQYSSSNPY